MRLVGQPKFLKGNRDFDAIGCTEGIKLDAVGVRRSPALGDGECGQRRILVLSVIVFTLVVLAKFCLVVNLWSVVALSQDFIALKLEVFKQVPFRVCVCGGASRA